MRPDNWYDFMEQRITDAKKAGWVVVSVGIPPHPFYFAHSDTYTGMGFTEEEAWSDILADSELWDEITAALLTTDPGSR